MDMLSIEGLEIETTIGVLDWERQIKQKLCFDLAWGVDVAMVANTDDIAASVDYALLSQMFQDFVENSAFFLIETLAESAAEFLLSTFKLPWLRLKLTKPGVINYAKSVSVTIERSSVLSAVETAKNRSFNCAEYTTTAHGRACYGDGNS